MRMAVFGGSFDPIHHGHLIVAGVAREALAADEVRLIPAGEQPFKVGRHHASGADRAAMAESAIAGMPGFAVDRVEIDRGGESYTIDTIRTLRNRFPEAEFYLLIGSDAGQLFEQWRDSDGIRAIANVVVFARDGEEPDRAVADRVITVPEIRISSTAVRDRVRSGLSIRFWVPDRVAQYIEAHGLYRD